MSALTRLSRGVLLVAACLTPQAVVVFADGPPTPQRELASPTFDELLTQNTLPEPVTPTGEEVTEATAELLHGVWHADIASMLQSEANTMTPEELAMMTAMLADFDVRFAFTASGLAGMAMTGMGEPQNEPGTWQLIEVNGNEVHFTVVSRDTETNELQTETFTATFVTTDYLRMSKPDDPQVIPFWRGVNEDPDVLVATITASVPPDGGAQGLTAPDSGLAAPSVGLTAPGATSPGTGGVAGSGSPGQPVPVTGLPVVIAQPSNLHGVWQADIASMLADEAANMEPEELAMMQALMEGMTIQFEFRSDGTARMSMTGMGQAETKTGTWRLLSVQGSSIRFELIETPALGTSPVPEQFTAAFDSTNNMTLTKDGDPQVIPFFRP